MFWIKQKKKSLNFYSLEEAFEEIDRKSNHIVMYVEDLLHGFQNEPSDSHLITTLMSIYQNIGHIKSLCKEMNKLNLG